MKFSFNIGCFSLMGLICLSMEILKEKEWTEFSWPHKVYNAKFSVKTHLEHVFGIEYTYFQ